MKRERERERRKPRTWEHANVRLWLGNDASLYGLACEAFRTSRTRTAAVDFIYTYGPRYTRDRARVTKEAIRRATFDWELGPQS